MKNLIESRKFHLIFFETIGSFILTYGACTSPLHTAAPDVIIALSLFLAISISG